MTAVTATEGAASRKVSLRLGIAILFLPAIFVWFLLRRGYSPIARIIGFGWLAFIIALVVAGSGSTPTADASSQPTTAPSEATAPPPPSHRWTYREGDKYGYQTELSDDDRKAGKGAASVIMFRYLGNAGGEYRLQAENGAIMSCANPCQVVKESMFGEVIDRVAYNPDTVIGGAFEDAFNGQMEAAPRPAAP